MKTKTLKLELTEDQALSLKFAINTEILKLIRLEKEDMEKTTNPYAGIAFKDEADKMREIESDLVRLIAKF
jgi:hypothetical protein